MYHLRNRNVNGLFIDGLKLIDDQAEVSKSRNGQVMAIPCPTVTCFDKPMERVLFDPVRDCNPFFHFMEGLWMLAGRNDVAFVKQFNTRMEKFSDDGTYLRGAYGYRWRQWFDRDQLLECITMLADNPTDRRVVMAMWDASEDLNSSYKDVPCNTHIYFRVVNKQLVTTICNRSNDLVWGLFGANAVHLSMLHEFMAVAVGVAVGPMYVLSNNLHVYTDLYPTEEYMDACMVYDMYAEGDCEPLPMLFYHGEGPEIWLREIEAFVEDPENCDHKPGFIADVAYPIWRTWQTRDLDDCQLIRADDWRIACNDWLVRRK